MTPMDMIDSLLKRRRILIVSGTGGVGKTTLSAAIAMRAALQGRNAIVITIDPAKRLATSLGLNPEQLGDEPTDLTEQLHQVHGAKLGTPQTGTLAALMPDTRKTFERFFEGLTDSPHTLERLKNNALFKIFAREFSGTNEYMALQKLLSIHESGRYDCIILDTPPSRNTLDFLEAPRLLSDFFEANLIQWLVVPANKIVSAGMRKALHLLEKLTGSGFMTHLLDFVNAIFEVRVKFSERLKTILSLIGSSHSGFLMVASPASGMAAELDHFIAQLNSRQFHFEGLIINRALSRLPVKESELEEALRRDSLGMQKALRLLQSLQRRENQGIEMLSNKTGALHKTPLILPELARDIHSIEDLYYVAMALDGRPLG